MHNKSLLSLLLFLLFLPLLCWWWCTTVELISLWFNIHANVISDTAGCKCELAVSARVLPHSHERPRHHWRSSSFTHATHVHALTHAMHLSSACKGDNTRCFCSLSNMEAVMWSVFRIPHPVRDERRRRLKNIQPLFRKMFASLGRQRYRVQLYLSIDAAKRRIVLLICYQIIETLSKNIQST